MKKLLASIFGLSLILVSCFSSSQTRTPPPPSNPTAIPWADRSIFKSGLVESEQSVLEDLDGASVYHIDMNVAEDLYHVSGHQEVQYTNTETVALDEIQFRLFPNTLGGEMKVSNLLIGGQSVTPELQLSDSLLIVPLAAPLEPGESTVIEIDFEVIIPEDVEQNYGMLSYYDGVLSLAHAYPMIPVYDDEGWNAEIPVEQGDITYSDASFYIVSITAPKEVTLVTSGKEFHRSGNSKTQTIKVASGPARDFFLATSPAYQEISKTFGEVTIRSYAPKGLEDGAKAVLEIAADSLELFNSKYPPYPYTELDLVATPTLAGGIEYPGAIVVTSNRYALKTDNPDISPRQVLEGIVAHEVAHQWFYNLVGDDQLDDPWLDEALAQYLTYEYFTHRYGPGGESGFRSSLEGRWSRVDFADIPIGLPVAEYHDNEYGAIVYGRGPLFFIALRDEMGQDIFDKFLRAYTDQLSWKIATPEILQSLAEEHCACDLDQLFNEWVYP